MRIFLISAAMLVPLLVGGCVRTVAGVVTAPVRVAAKVVDWSTTSPSERDRAYIRRQRKQEERAAREQRARDKACRRDPSTCPAPYEGARPER